MENTVSIQEAEDTSLLEDEKNTVDVFRSLKVLALLRENQKLCSESLGLRVESRWPAIQWLVRYFASEDREKNLQSVERILAKAFKMTDAALRRQEQLNNNKVMNGNDNKFMNENDLIVKSLRNQHIIERLRLSIQAACSGIKSLVETYKHDGYLIASVEVLLDSVSDKLSEIDRASSLLHSRNPS